MYYILQRLKADEPPEDNKWAFTIRMPWLNVESRFAVRLHLFALIFEVRNIYMIKCLKTKLNRF